MLYFPSYLHLMETLDDCSEEVIHIEIYSEAYKRSRRCRNSNLERSVSTAESISSVYEEVLLGLDDGISTWMCGECGLCVLTRKKLYHHINRSHHSPTPEECFMCKTIFIDRSHLQDHLSLVHLVGQTELVCDVCFQQFEKRSERDLHVSLHPNVFKCKWCSDMFPSQYHVSVHQITHKHSLHGYECSICGSHFENKHICDAHIDRHNQASCQMCSYFVQNHAQQNIKEDDEVLLLKHIKATHSSDNIMQFLQELREKDEEERKLDHSLKDENTLPEGIISEPQFTCDKGLSSSVGPIQNLQDIFTSRSSDEELYQLLTISQSEIQTCKTGYDFKLTECQSKVQLKQPLQGLSSYRTQSTSLEKSQPKVSSSHEKMVCSGHCSESFSECSKCQDKLKSKDEILKHELDHLKPFICEVCSFKFTHRREYKKHLHTHGVQDDKKHVNYKCSQCDVHCSTLAGLRKHILIHTEHKPFLCEICGRKFRRSRALHIHIETVHRPINFFHCSQCGSKMRSQDSLHRHTQRVHGGVRRFICGLCGVRCLQNQDLRRHLKLIHDSTFPPLPSISKKSKDKVHVIPSLETLRNADPLSETIRSAVREEELKLIELQRTLPVVCRDKGDQQQQSSEYSHSTAESKQPLILLGDVAAQASPLKQTVDVTPHENDLTSNSSMLNRNSICHYVAENAYDLASPMVEHGLKILSSAQTVRAISLPPAQMLMLCSLSTYNVSNPTNSTATVSADIFPAQGCVLPSGPIDLTSPLVCLNAASNSYNVQDFRDNVDNSLTFHNLGGISIASELITSNVQNITLGTCSLSPLKTQPLTVNNGVNSHLETCTAMNLEDNNVIFGLNESSVKSALPFGTVSSITSHSHDYTVKSKSKEAIYTLEKSSNNSVKENATQLAASVEDLGEFLKEKVLPPAHVSNVNDAVSKVGVEINMNEFPESYNLQKNQEDSENVPLWNDELRKPVSQVVYPTKFSSKNKKCIPVTLLSESETPKIIDTSSAPENRDQAKNGLDHPDISRILPYSSFKDKQGTQSRGAVHVNGTLSSTDTSVQPGEEKIFTCQECKKQLSSSYNLKRHLMIHNAEKPYTCPECCKTFRHEFNLNTHLRSHTGERPYCCKVCSKIFRYLRELKDHYSIHEGRKPYQCMECGLRFTRQRELARHVQKHRPSQRLKCKFCHKMFSRIDYLKLHVMKLHSKITNVSSEEKKSNLGESGSSDLNCESCKEDFTCSSEHCSHQNTYEETESQINSDKALKLKMDQHYEASEKVENTSQESLWSESSLLQNNAVISKEYFQVVDGQVMDGNLIDVAYQAAKGGLQLICVKEVDKTICEKNTGEINSGNLANIVYVDFLDPSATRIQSKVV